MGLELVDAEQLIARLAAVRQPGDIFASDGDHTIWRGDVGEHLFEAALEKRWLRPQAQAALAREAEAHGLSADGDAHELAARLYEAQQRGAYPDLRAYGMQAWCFAGYGEIELEERCAEVLDAIGFADRVKGWVRPVLDFADEHDHAFWLVSASCTAMCHVCADRVGIPRHQVVAMDPVVEQGVVQPMLAAEETHAEGKVRRLRARTEAPLLAGFGDSVYDAAMMKLARLPVAISPKKELAAALETGLRFDG